MRDILRQIKRRIRIFQFERLIKNNELDLSKVKFIGVTGTSGKTTTSTMIYHLLKECGFKIGLISTNGVFINNEKLDSGFHVTTPDGKDLISFVKRMLQKKIEYIVLETSSHALEQGRIGDIKFEFAVYTNIKSDHLDWHGSWANYVRAKARLLDMLTLTGKIIFNKDDTDSYEILKTYLQNHEIKNTSYDYSVNEVSGLEETLDGTLFEYRKTKFELPILGNYNISNALAAIKVSEGLGIKIDDISAAFKKFTTVEGRMEIMQKGPFTVILDFAHNADSLEKSLQTARNLANKGKVISVFGSAGLRDFNKRFDMGKISGKLADITIITAEDPRTEKLKEINDEIIKGAEAGGAMLVKRFRDHKEFLQAINSVQLTTNQRLIFVFDEESVASRFDAIAFAIKIAGDNDVVITNGKGHEQSLCFGKTEYPFSDKDAIKKALLAN